MGWVHFNPEIQEVPLLQRPANTRTTELSAEEDLTTWDNDDVTLTKDFSDPEGKLSNAFTMERTGKGNASISKKVENLDLTKEYVFSVWAKGGTETTLRLGLFASPPNRWRLKNMQIEISTTEWKQYWVQIPGAALTTTTRLYIFIGDGGNDVSSGTIQLWKPQFEYGN